MDDSVSVEVATNATGSPSSASDVVGDYASKPVDSPSNATRMVGGIDPSALLGSTLLRKLRGREEGSGSTSDAGRAASVTGGAGAAENAGSEGNCANQESGTMSQENKNETAAGENEDLENPGPRVISFSIIESVTAPSDARLVASHSVSYERPSGPKKRHAPTRPAFVSVSVDEEDLDKMGLPSPQPLQMDLVDQVAFHNPLMESGDSGESVPVGVALAKQALEQMKNLKKAEVVERPASPVAAPELMKVQLRKTEQVDKRPVSLSIDKPSEAQLALSRLKKVENSPMAKERSNTNSFDLSTTKPTGEASPSANAPAAKKKSSVAVPRKSALKNATGDANGAQQGNGNEGNENEAANGEDAGGSKKDTEVEVKAGSSKLGCCVIL